MSGLDHENVMTWSVDEVLGWLRNVHLSEFSEFVSLEKIDGPNLIQLDKGRISNCRNVPKGKRDALLKRLKDFEKEKMKMQKLTKREPKTSNGRTAPVVNSPPAPIVRGAAPQPEDDGDDEFVDDDEWDEVDQDIYDNDESSQPSKRRSQKPHPPPPPPMEVDSEEDYVVPDVSNSPPSFRAPQAPSNNDDSYYEKANEATSPTVKTVPPPRNVPAAMQRPVPPPPPTQGPNVPPPRGSRAPVVPPRELILHKETDPDSLPRNQSPPPPPPSSGPKEVRTQRSLPHEIHEGTEEHQTPPSLPRGVREGRPVPPRPSTEIYEDPTEEQDPLFPHYESMEELKAKMDQATPMARERGPVPVPQRDSEEKTAQVVTPARSMRLLPSTPVDDDIYEATDEQDEPRAISTRPLPPKPAIDDFYEATDEQVPTAKSVRPPPPNPPPDEFYEAADEQKVSPVISTRPPPPKPVTDEFYESTDEQLQNIPPPPPPPPPPAKPSKPDRHRAVPAIPAEQHLNDEPCYTETDESPKPDRKLEEDRPQKPEKQAIADKRTPAGLPSIGFDVNTVVVRDAKTKLRPAIRKDCAEERITADKPSPQQDKAMGIGGIREIFQAKTLATGQKKPPAAPPVKNTPVYPTPHLVTESNTPGAPEPRKRRQERDPPPGPPGPPSEIVKSPAAVASPVTDPNDITSQPWYFGNCGREKATEMLKQSKEEGTYLVRDSKGSGQPYTLCIYYRGDTFNIAIRNRTDGKFALGTEKPDEHVFETICDMIRFHRNNAIEVSKTGNLAGKVKLAKVAGK